MTMSLAGLTHLIVSSTTKHALEFGEGTRSRGRVRRGCLKKMLEIHQVIPSLLTKCNLNTPTTSFPDDLAAVLRFFFDILGVRYMRDNSLVRVGNGREANNSKRRGSSLVATMCLIRAHWLPLDRLSVN